MTKAETIWALKVVDSNFSFMSTHDLVDILAAMDPKSDVFKKMSMGETKTSYLISHGLYPYFLKKIVKAIQDSPAYSLGTDAGTFKLHGLTKCVDIVIRFAHLLLAHLFLAHLLVARCSLLSLNLYLSLGSGIGIEVRLWTVFLTTILLDMSRLIPR